MSAKPVGVVRIGRRKSKEVMVICEDGSSFIYSGKSGDWAQLEPVPNTKRAEEDARQAVSF